MPNWLNTLAQAGGLLYVVTLFLCVLWVCIIIAFQSHADRKRRRAARKLLTDYNRADIEYTQSLYHNMKGSHSDSSQAG